MNHTPWQHATADTTYDPARILCYDSEFVRERSYIPKLALVQTCQPGGNAHLYDPLDGADAVPWHNILHHPAPVVLHAGAQDLELMQLCGGALPATIRDTQTGFALCSPHLAVSYAALVEHYLGIAPDKSQTRSDWLARPLNAAQLDYAADDVGLLARLYPLLVADLQRLGRLAWWAEESAAQLARQQQPREAWHWYRLQGAPQLRHDDKPAAQILVEARERIAAARDLAARLHAVVVLKGKYSIISAPNGDTLINPTGNAGMAKGGSGDVLAGIIAALLAQGYEPFPAAAIGVYLHGLAADIAVAGTHLTSLTAHDLIAAIPAALQNTFPAPPIS